MSSELYYILESTRRICLFDACFLFLFSSFKRLSAFLSSHLPSIFETCKSYSELLWHSMSSFSHYKDPCDYVGPTWIISHLKVSWLVSLILPATLLPLPCNLTYLPVPSIRMWMSLGTIILLSTLGIFYIDS